MPDRCQVFHYRLSTSSEAVRIVRRRSRADQEHGHFAGAEFAAGQDSVLRIGRRCHQDGFSRL